MRQILSNTIKNFKNARFTYLIITYCLLVFFGISFEKKDLTINDGIITKYGAPTAIEIYSGKQWGLITNSFVHFEIGHLFLNLFGTFLLATYIERRIGFWKLFLLGLMASFVSSTYQLAFSNDAGIGLSGVNYTLFGFIFGKSFFDKKFKISSRYIILFTLIAFIFFCELMNLLNYWNVATISLSSGLIFGITVSILVTQYKKLGIIFNSIIFSFALTSIYFAPWSAQWNCSKAIRFHEQGFIKQAKLYYMKALNLDTNSNCAIDNLRLIRIDELSGKALEFHMHGKYIEAKRIYDEILRIDPTNQWAKTNMDRLP